MDAFIDDGYEALAVIDHVHSGDTRIEINPPLQFTYRPCTAPDYQKHVSDLQKNAGALGAIEVALNAKMLASRITGWNRGTPVNERTVSQANQLVFVRMVNIVLGLEESDPVAEEDRGRTLTQQQLQEETGN